MTRSDGAEAERCIARSAAKKTASVSGPKTLTNRWVHPCGDKFTFVDCTSVGKGVSRTGRLPRRSIPGPTVVEATVCHWGERAVHGAQGTKNHESVGHTADDGLTDADEKILADWDEYTMEELIAMGGVDSDVYELGEGP